jgi:hypothetical protein
VYNGKRSVLLAGESLMLKGSYLTMFLFGLCAIIFAILLFIIIVVKKIPI